MNPMHFCAKPRCRRWYHRQCLLSNSETIERDPGTYLGRKGIHHLAADPDEEDSHPDFAPFTYKAPPPGLGRGKMSDPAWAEMRWSEIHLTLLAHLPSMLIEVAQHPILRCAGREEYSIAGNVKEVILARRMVCQVLEGWHRFVDEIIESLGSEEAFEDRKLDDLLKVLGPGTRAYHRMSHTRILASPYAPYWERRAERRKKLADAEGIPFLRCPRCTSVV